MLKFSTLESICGGKISRLFKDQEITLLITDSRKALASAGALFFALRGERHDGHHFLAALYASGFRQFVIEQQVDLSDYPEGNFLQVESSLFALQDLAAHHRQQFSIPVIGITGSNGKTIVKEWLYQLLSPDYNTVKNPGSYNSQIGVPLSVWQMQKHHELGIFEAGISQPNEMNRLQKIIKPTLGIFTTLGPAHDEGFENSDEKISEKLQLFKNAGVIIYNKDQPEVARGIEKKAQPDQKLFHWGTGTDANIQVKRQAASVYQMAWMEKDFTFHFPFSNVASIENAFHCIATMVYLGYSAEQIQERIGQLKTVPMRLELKQGINHCQIIDDTYNNDLAGVQISLDFLVSLRKKRATLILSDILQSGLDDKALVGSIAEVVSRASVDSFIGVGPKLHRWNELFKNLPEAKFYENTEEFLEQIDWTIFQHEVILIKGARSFRFERIVQHFQKKIHGTVMEVNLGALVHNLNFFRGRLNPGVKLMVMVKAFAYGSGSEEVARLLQYHHVDYLGVAYADEGVELRKNSIQLPILVMNPSEDSFASIVTYRLEPEIYSLSILKSFALFLNGAPFKIHVKIDTGMHRLGLEEAELPTAIAVLRAHPNIEIVSLFSHLAAADQSAHDDFTRHQIERFLSLANVLKSELNINPLLHILNSSGILRFKDYQFNMVRLGIGLFGVDPTGGKENHLEVVATLKTIISQIKVVKIGESIGYGRKGRARKKTTIGTIAIGYADGFSRRFSEGTGSVWINGKLAPVIGNVCMDMTMVDITDIAAEEGDEVIVFGKELPLDEVAERINTIPYEILTGTSERVKRVFYTESI